MMMRRMVQMVVMVMAPEGQQEVSVEESRESSWPTHLKVEARLVGCYRLKEIRVYTKES